MLELFFFNKLIVAGCCLSGFFLWCRLQVILLKRTGLKIWTARIGVAVEFSLLGKLWGGVSEPQALEVRKFIYCPIRKQL